MASNSLPARRARPTRGESTPHLAALDGVAIPGGDAQHSQRDLVPRMVYRMRRARDQFFPSLFADPCWDILLDLYENRRLGKPVSISSACVAAACPPTTALRHLGQLVSTGLVDRRPCPNDSRRIYVELTPKALDAIDSWIERAVYVLEKG